MGSNTVATTEKSIEFEKLFSKYLKLGLPDITEFLSSIPIKFDTGIKSLRDKSIPQIDSGIKINRKSLSKKIIDFHSKAGTFTNVIERECKNLENERVKIVVAIHQPNLFAFSGVFKKIVLLEYLTRLASNPLNGDIIPVFLIIDHDFMDDNWVHVAKLPSVRHSSGVLDLRYTMNELKRWKLIFNTEPPNRSTINYWEIQVYKWIKNCKIIDSEELRSILNNFKKFWLLVEDSLLASSSYSEFNSFIISKIVNEVWGYSTLFVNLSDLSPTFKNGYNFLLSNYKTYSSSLESSESFFRNRGITTGVSTNSSKYSPLWIHCRCGSKGSSIIEVKDNHKLELVGKCISCKKILKIDIGSTASISIDESKIKDLSPRAIPILLLLSRELEISGYVTGTGGSFGYTLVGKKVFDDLKINMPSIFVWGSHDEYKGFAQKEALEYLKHNNLTNIPSAIKNFKIEYEKFANQIYPLIRKRKQVYNDKVNLEKLLNNLFFYKEQQRNLKKKLKNVENIQHLLNLKPCIIDYAVNFGIKDVSNYWSNHLINGDGDLFKPVVFNTQKHEKS